MKLASVERIRLLTPIPDAHSIELATVLGWQVIVRKGDFRVGDLAVYVPIDTTVDPARTEFAFLGKATQRARVKTAKIKGVYSQGLLLPTPATTTYEEHQDVAAEYNVQKYEKDAATQPNTTSTSPFPTEIIPKTDEDNARSVPEALTEVIGLEGYIALKLDGSSMTVISNTNTNTVRVCSRNMEVDTAHAMYKYVTQEGIDARLKTHKPLAIQGEFCGPALHKNRLGLKAPQWYVFTIKDLVTNTYMGLEEMEAACRELGLTMVPILERILFDETWTVDAFQQYANQVQYPNKTPGEGIVVRPLYPVQSKVMQKPWSVKVLSQVYKD